MSALRRTAFFCGARFLGRCSALGRSSYGCAARAVLVLRWVLSSVVPSVDALPLPASRTFPLLWLPVVRLGFDARQLPTGRVCAGVASFVFSVVFHSSVRFSPSLASLRSVFCRRLSSSDLRSARATCRRSPRTPVPLALLVACLPSAALRSSRPLSLCLLAVVAIIVAIIGRRSYIDLEPNTKPKPDRRRSGRHPRLPPQGIRRSPSI